MKRLSNKFPSRKVHLLSQSKVSSQVAPPSSLSSLNAPGDPGRRDVGVGKRRHCVAKSSSIWSVYLLASTRLPRTYVGVTTNFYRRLKQHNGELKGGAKASSAGRPWSLACIIQGFKDRSEACKFETKWKSLSRKTARKKNKDCPSTNLLLQHREAALIQAKASFDCNNLWIQWLMKP
ncbi:structure-specific endonuclease subunit SLX1 homolog isoform X2 [Phalaenopsis equestris]|uniref:structure-specific endonuclease subunit SLX1 homolog isoform X2 n=1 Tax=Phalaenopsis equestris TaxID=78828 RepID=UPI0009E198DF|nr:structure-specific endonuclease subunit SLX1 homolog isoform X2 [Phalaenopsis equestris]